MNSETAGMILLSKDENEWPYDLKQNVDSTIDVVLNLNKVLLSKNIKLHVLMAPMGYAWESEPVHENEWFSDFSVTQEGIEQYLSKKLEAQGVRYIDLRKPFSLYKKKNPNDSLFFSVGSHWNSKGHEIVFSVLRDEYERLTWDNNRASKSSIRVK